MAKKQSAGSIFLGMFLRAAVIILGIIILIFGIVILRLATKGSTKSDKKSGPVTTVNESVMEDPGARDELLDTTEEAAQVNYGIKILVLNSTQVQGLAGSWCEKLNQAGYASTEKSDYGVNLETTKVVAKTEGVGTELTEYFNGATYEVGTVSENVSVDTSAYDVVVIVGNSDSQ